MERSFLGHHVSRQSRSLGEFLGIRNTVLRNLKTWQFQIFKCFKSVFHLKFIKYYVENILDLILTRRLSGFEILNNATSIFQIKVIYPSVDPYDYHREERLKLHLLNPDDLSVITIIETSTTSDRVGHVFMMCGVLYASDPDTEQKPGIIR